MKKIITFIIVFVLIFSFSVNSFATPDKSFYIHNLERASDSTGGLVNSYTYSSKSCSRIYFNNVGRYCTYFSLPLNLTAGQTYFVTFSLARSSGFDCEFQVVYSNRQQGTGEIIYYNNFTQFGTAWESTSFSFVYSPTKQYLEFSFLGNSTNNYGYISVIDITRYNPNAELESKMDEQNSLVEEQNSILDEQNETISGGFSRIGQWFTNLINSISQWFTDLTNSISGFFSDLADSIGNFFNMLKNYLLYFQHPVTLNADGVPVDEYGEPVYTNPFEDLLTDIESFFDDMFSNLDDFIDKISESSVTISGYIDIFTNAFERFGASATVFVVFIDFALVFFVIRKIMGR